MSPSRRVAANHQLLWHNGHAVVARLRGLPIYQQLAGVEPDLLRFDEWLDPDDNETDQLGRWWRINATDQLDRGYITPIRGSAVRVITPGDAGVVRMLDRFREVGYAVVVDVTMPIGHIDLAFSMEQDPALKPYADEHTREHWRPGGEAQACLIDAVTMADAVTVPYPEFGIDIAEHVPMEKVFTLPDWGTVAEEEYIGLFGQVLRHANNHRWPDSFPSIVAQNWGTPWA